MGAVVADLGEQDAGAAASQVDEHGDVTPTLGSFAVVRPGSVGI